VNDERLLDEKTLAERSWPFAVKSS